MESSNYSYQLQHSSLYNYYFPKSNQKYTQIVQPPAAEDDYQTVKSSIYILSLNLCLNNIFYFSANIFANNDKKLDFLVKIIFRIFSLNANLFFLIVSIIQLAWPDLSPFLRWIYIAPLGFYVLFDICKEVFFNYQKVKFDNSINHRKTQRLSFSRTGKGTEEVTWEKLEVGNIVYLKEGDYVPADIVVLDTSEMLNRENVCHISTKLIDGQKNLSTKKASKITKVFTDDSEPKFFSYSHILSGTLEFAKASGDYEHFKGVLKLNKDPRVELLGKDNFIMKMSKVKNTNWLIGIVVYGGSNAKILYGADFLRQKTNFAYRVTSKFNYFMIFIVVLLAMISLVAFIGGTLNKEYIKRTEYYTNASKFFFYVVQYANFVPLSIYFTLDIIELIHYFRVRSKKKGANKSFVIPYNTKSFANLGTIDYVVTDTTALTINNEFGVQQVYVNEILYEVEQNNLHEKVQKQSLEESSDLSLSESNDIKLKKAVRKKLEGKIIPEESGNSYSEQNIEEEKKNNDEEEESNQMPVVSLAEVLGETETIDHAGPLTMDTQIDAPLISTLPITGQAGSEQYLVGDTPKNNNEIRLESSGEEESDSDELDIDEKTTDGFVRDLFHKERVRDVLRCILISAEATVVKDKQELKIKTTSQEEKMLLRFAKNCQFTLEESAAEAKKSIRMGNILSEFTILGDSEPFLEKGKFSVVVAPHPAIMSNGGVAFSPVADLNESSIYVKGYYNKVRHLMKLPAQRADILDQTAEELYQLGKIPIVFAKKKLTLQQVEKFKEKFTNFKTNLNVQPEAREKIFDELETDLEFVGLCALGQRKEEAIGKTLQTLTQAGINTWVVSNEPFENILLLMRSYNLLSQSRHHFFLEGESQESVAISMKLHMGQFRKIFETEKKKDKNSRSINAYYKSLSENVLKQMNEYVIIISGKAFQFIRNDKTTYDNFAFLCAVSARVIGFSFTSQDKQALIKMAKAKFSDKTQVMAVGTTYSDVPMLNAADVGIFSTNFKENSLHPWGDIKTSDIMILKKLLLEQGITFTHQLDHTIYYLFYKSVVLTLPLFYFNWFSTMTGTSVYDSVMLFLFNFLFTLLPILALTCDQPISKKYINMYPAFYAESCYKKLHLIKKFIVRVITEGVLHATLAFYLCLYHIAFSADKYADPGDIGMLSLTMALSLVFIVDFKMFFHFERNQIPIWATVAFSLTLLFGFLWINTRANFTEIRGSSVDLERFIHRPNVILLFLLVVFGCLAISYLLINYLILLETASAWQILSLRYRKGKLKEFDNPEILNTLKYRENQLSRIIKKVYRDADKLEGFVLEMLNMFGKDFSRVNLRRFTLAFDDYALEQRFQYTKMTTSLRFVKLCFYIGTTIFIILSIVIAATDSHLGAYDIARFIASIVFIGICFFVNTRWYQQHFTMSNVAIALLLIILKTVSDYVTGHDDAVLTAIFILVLCTFFLFGIQYAFLLTLIMIIPFYIRQYMNYEGIPDEQERFYVLFSNYILLTCLILVSLYSGMQLEKQSRNEFIASISIDSQNSAYNNILSILVPDFVKTLLNRGVRCLAEDQGQVAILFCDICDFDDLIRDVGAEVVDILDNLWRQFDKYCIDQGIQKIETVGKTYMACAGLKSTEREFSTKIMTQNPTKRVVNMCIEMMDYVEGLTIETKDKREITLKIRIGVHYGRVIAGIIGEHKPQFSLVGANVNYTSRVCSTGHIGKITLSEAAYMEVKSRGLYFTREQVFAKGIGKIWTYILQKEKKTGKHTERLDPSRSETLRAVKSILGDLANPLGLPDELNVVGQQNQNPTSPRKGELDIVSNTDLKIKKAAGKKDTIHMMFQDMLTNPVTKSKLKQGVREDDKETKKKKKKEKKEKKKKRIKSQKDLEKEKEKEWDKDNVETRVQLLRPSRFFLYIKPSPVKAEYELQKCRKYRRFFTMMMLFLAIIIFAQTLLTLIVRDSLDVSPRFVGVRAVFSGLLILLALVGGFLTKKEWLERILLFIFLLYGCFVVIYQSYDHNPDPVTQKSCEIDPDCDDPTEQWFAQVAFLELTVILVIGLTSKKFDFLHCIVFYVVVTIIWFIFWGMNPNLNYIFIFYYITLMLYILGKQYITDKKDIRTFNLGVKQNQRNYEQNTLISQLLPDHALEKLLSGHGELTDEMEDVTLLFSDIAGFTNFSNSREPEEVVRMLTELFTEFDKMCVKLGVYKVYTIGDAYIIMGFTNAKERDPGKEAGNIVEMGMAMIDIIRNVRMKLGYNELEMRIGIHTGKVIGGIIGTDIVRYDLYGKDYLIGNKMESAGKEGMIQVSETTKRWLERQFPGKYRFEEHATVEIKKLESVTKGYLIYHETNYAEGRKKPKAHSFTNGRDRERESLF